MDILNQILKFPLRRRRDLGDAIRSLLRIKGEASAIKLAHEILQRYTNAESAEKITFFQLLASDLGPDASVLNEAITAYQGEPSPANFTRLQSAVEPPRQDLIRTLNWVPGGTAAIIAMRADLLRFARDDAALRIVDYDFQHLLSSWFNRGFLDLQRISWNTPAKLLEKLIHYESVHEITDWRDLQRRLASDRRCFAFFHPQLPDEPLIFVEVALTKGLVSDISDVLDKAIPDTDEAAPDTAIFYSINNCQVGLQGISFGNFLIKQVADELAEEMKTLRHFATLSPIPGFRRWLDQIRTSPQGDHISAEDVDTLASLDDATWWQNEETTALLQPLMTKLCARYLLEEKRGEEPIDPVARFHLSNGARVERINWLGDVSAQRLEQSYGLLVNYVYDRRSVIKNHEQYVAKGKVAASSALSSAAK